MSNASKLTIERIAAGLTKLGIDFCPSCGEPHNTLSIRGSDLDGYIGFSMSKGGDVHVCAACAPEWLKKNKRKIAPRKLGFALASWILDQSVHDADHQKHEVAVALCAAHDIRFDLLLHRRAKASRTELHFWTEEQLLESLGYQWDLEARQINKAMLDYIEHVRAGGKCSDLAWPPVKKAA